MKIILPKDSLIDIEKVQVGQAGYRSLAWASPYTHLDPASLASLAALAWAVGRRQRVGGAAGA